MAEHPTPPLSKAGSSRDSSPMSDPPEELPVQPAFFYPSGHNVPFDVEDEGFLTPDQDPLATRGIPVFRPTYEEFQDFEAYMTRVELWGRKSGIVKVIPPKEWTDALPPVNPMLSKLRLRNPIEQHMMGQSGLFRQNNVEKRRNMTLKDWADLCTKDELKALPIKDGNVVTRGQRAARKPRTNKKAAKAAAKEEQAEQPNPASVDETPAEAPARAQSTVATDYPTPQSNSSHDHIPPASDGFIHHSALPPQIVAEDPWYANFDPRTAWLPQDTQPEDYTPEACRELERVFWRSCGIGAPAQYGADMPGSLFNEAVKSWNVAHLPSFLGRLCQKKQLPGVTTPYLYYGMWRATFAWHVEDMDLYSINYIHWGAPKYWYAIPNERSKAFEGVMKGLFPGESSECPQYLRHKAFLASPTLLSQSSCRPNTLVQHQGEFVITFPRGYHAGFNLGLNCAESVNFALESWVELGRTAGVCNCVGDSVRIDVDSLLNGAEEHLEQEKLELAVAVGNKRPLEEDPSAQPSKDTPKRKRVKKEPPPGMISSAAPFPSYPSSSAGPSKLENIIPRARLPKVVPTPCCLCASETQDALLPVHDPPHLSTGARPFVTKATNGADVEVWQAHEKCAMVIPETWIDVVNGRKYVFGVDGIVKDRWLLNCSQCTRTSLKGRGAKVQCTKGKCPKAFHVSCAIHGVDVGFKELGEMEKDVMIYAPDPNVPPLAPTADGIVPEQQGRIVKSIRKLAVEVLCPQHNPVVIERKKEAKLAQIRKDALALQPNSRIKVKFSGSTCEVTVVSLNERRETVTVLWKDGNQKDFSWKNIIWNEAPAPQTGVQQLSNGLPSVNATPRPLASGPPGSSILPQAGPSSQPVRPLEARYPVIQPSLPVAIKPRLPQSYAPSVQPYRAANPVYPPQPPAASHPPPPPYPHPHYQYPTNPYSTYSPVGNPYTAYRNPTPAFPEHYYLPAYGGYAPLQSQYHAPYGYAYGYPQYPHYAPAQPGPALPPMGHHQSHAPLPGVNATAGPAPPPPHGAR